MSVMLPAVLQQLQSGLEAHRRGDLAAAERSYRAVLVAAPEALDAYNLLGRLLVQTGRATEAGPLLRQAIDRAGNQPALWLSYTEALLAAGQIDPALDAAETVRHLAPGDPDAIFVWAEAKRLAAAWDEAAQGYREVLAIRPQQAAAWLQLATSLRSAGAIQDAQEAAERALALAPQAPECHNNLGSLFAVQGDHDAALKCFDAALSLRPDYPAALVNKAASLRETGRAVAALPVAELALKLSQGHPDAWAAIGQVRHSLGDLDAALVAYREALARRPLDAETQWNYALAALAKGDFTSGWPAFAWRWRKAEPPLPRRAWPWPPAQGERDFAGKRLLLWGEQGLGDRLLFLQYLPALVEQGAQVTLETDPRLIPLLQRSFPAVRFAAEGSDASPALMAQDFDLHLPLGDLPQREPPGLAYLQADGVRVAELRSRYRADSTSRLVGLSWRSANAVLGGDKSVAPAELATLAAIPDCRFICLQYGATEAEHAALRAIFGNRYLVDPAVDAQRDLDGLAAQIAALDLVITVSNVTAHLAGALGTPVWVLAPAGKSLFFYLMGEGEGTPWYPGMRIFRKSGSGWSGALEAAAKRLELLEKPPAK